MSIEIEKLSLNLALDIAPVKTDMEAQRLRHVLTLLPELIKKEIYSLGFPVNKYDERLKDIHIALPPCTSVQLINDPCAYAGVIAGELITAFVDRDKDRDNNKDSEGAISNTGTKNNTNNNNIKGLQPLSVGIGHCKQFSILDLSHSELLALITHGEGLPDNLSAEFCESICAHIIHLFVSNNDGFSEKLEKLLINPLVQHRLLNLMKKCPIAVSAKMLLALGRWASRETPEILTSLITQYLEQKLSIKVLIYYVLSLRVFAPAERLVRFSGLLLVNLEQSKKIIKQHKSDIESVLLCCQDNLVIKGLMTWLNVLQVQEPNKQDFVSFAHILTKAASSISQTRTTAVNNELILGRWAEKQASLLSQQRLKLKWENFTQYLTKRYKTEGSLFQIDEKLMAMLAVLGSVSDVSALLYEKENVTHDKGEATYNPLNKERALPISHRKLLQKWQAIAAHLFKLNKTDNGLVVIENHLEEMVRLLDSVSLSSELKIFRDQLNVCQHTIHRRRWPLNWQQEWEQAMLVLSITYEWSRHDMVLNRDFHSWQQQAEKILSANHLFLVESDDYNQRASENENENVGAIEAIELENQESKIESIVEIRHKNTMSGEQIEAITRASVYEKSVIEEVLHELQNTLSNKIINQPSNNQTDGTLPLSEYGRTSAVTEGVKQSTREGTLENIFENTLEATSRYTREDASRHLKISALYVMLVPFLKPQQETIVASIFNLLPALQSKPNKDDVFNLLTLTNRDGDAIQIVLKLLKQRLSMLSKRNKLSIEKADESEVEGIYQDPKTSLKGKLELALDIENTPHRLNKHMYLSALSEDPIYKELFEPFCRATAIAGLEHICKPMVAAYSRQSLPIIVYRLAMSWLTLLPKNTKQDSLHAKIESIRILLGLVIKNYPKVVPFLPVVSAYSRVDSAVIRRWWEPLNDMLVESLSKQAVDRAGVQVQGKRNTHGKLNTDYVSHVFHSSASSLGEEKLKVMHMLQSERVSEHQYKKCFDQYEAEILWAKSQINDLPLEEVGKHVRLIEESIQEMSVDDDLYSLDGGLILLWPFISTLYSTLKLTEEQKKGEGAIEVHFIDEMCQAKAFSLLLYMLGETECAGFYGVINILVGYEVDSIVDMPIALTESEKEEANRLLRSVIKHWEALRAMPIQSFQSLFLQRKVECRVTDTGYYLVVEHQTIDILLQKLPWGLGMVNIPWLGGKLISVDWRY